MRLLVQRLVGQLVEQLELHGGLVSVLYCQFIQIAHLPVGLPVWRLVELRAQLGLRLLGEVRAQEAESFLEVWRAGRLVFVSVWDQEL